MEYNEHETGRFSSTTDHQAALCRLKAAIEGINDAVRNAVESGLSVEVFRACRHHDGAGNWGDQMNVRPHVRPEAGTQGR